MVRVAGVSTLSFRRRLIRGFIPPSFSGCLMEKVMDYACFAA